ncbi:MAG: hypothetical protein NVS4B12_17080 [Ktedonobacteraceae bacterium]
MKSTDIAVIHQDHHLLVLNKPAGVVIHPTYKNADGGTLWDALLIYLSQQAGEEWQPPVLPDEPAWAGAPPHIQIMLRERQQKRLWKEEGPLPRPCLLHRLDKDTSGVVALARTERSRRHIIKQFHDHTIEKCYLAVVRKGAPLWARPRSPLGVARHTPNEQQALEDSTFDFLTLGNDILELNGPLQRDPDERRRCIVGPDGDESITRCSVLASENDFFLLDVQPVTGRTHQIRAHLAACGYAIVGDQMYAPRAEDGTPEAALTRQFLHAYSLQLRRYPDNALCAFVAPLANDLVAWLRQYFPSGLGALNAKTTIPTA